MRTNEWMLRAGAMVVALGGIGCGDNLVAERVPDVTGEINTTFGSTGQYFRFRAVNSGKCIDVSGASTADNAAFVQFTCATANNGLNQQLYFRRLGTNYQLSVKHSAKCARPSGASTASGAAVVQWPCARTGSGLTGSQWTFTHISNGRYQVRNTNSNRCLRIRGNSTANNAVVEQGTCSTATNYLFTVEAVPPPANNPPVTGQWGPVVTLPSVPVAAALLPDGKVVTWASYMALAFGGTPAQTHTAIFDPIALTSSAVLVTNTLHDMFCPGTAMLADGRVFVNGGGNTVDETSIYDATTANWAIDDEMTQRRWYNVSVTLGDNRVFTLGGNLRSGLSGTGEVWSAAGGWVTVPGALMAPLASSDPATRWQEHPRLFLAPDGRVFVPGPTPNMQFYNLSGSGSVQSAGLRGDDEFSQNDVTVMYDTGKFFKAGGNPNYDFGTVAPNVPSSHNSYLIDINAGVSVTKVTHMRYPRAYANGVVLPTGEVLVVGGIDNANAFTDSGAVMVPELFNPVTSTWTELAAMARPRTYHSVALLLPDARVLVGGGGLCGSTCVNNHPDVEIYSPPYLFQAARPQITSAPQTISYGLPFTVDTTGTVTGFALVRASSVTHTVNTDQRLLRPVFAGIGPFVVTAPLNGNVAPPGTYMLFAMNGNVPSVAAMVRLN